MKLRSRQLLRMTTNESVVLYEKQYEEYTYVHYIHIDSVLNVHFISPFPTSLCMPASCTAL